MEEHNFDFLIKMGENRKKKGFDLGEKKRAIIAYEEFTEDDGKKYVALVPREGHDMIMLY